MGNLNQVSLAYTAAAANNIAQSQSPGAGAITLNGSLVTGGVAVLDAARRVLLTSGSSDTGITFTVVGTNRNGNAMTETVTGGATTASTTQDFKTVSSVTHSGSVAGTLTIGTSGIGSSQWVAVDNAENPVNVGIGVVISGTINFTVEYTYDNVNAPFTGTFPTVFPITALTSKAVNTDGSLLTPAFAVRVTQNSFTNPGNLKMIVIQSGLGAF